MQSSEHGIFEGTLACILVQIGVTSCECIYSGEDGMLEGTFAGLLLKVASWKLCSTVKAQGTL